MKFCKKYQAYIQEQQHHNQQQQQLPGLGFKKLKKLLKRCGGDAAFAAADHRCSGCDGTFFPSLIAEMSEIVGCFNRRAERLMNQHLAAASSGFRRCLVWFLSGKMEDGDLIREGRDLVTYALINAIAVRKILKKYDKIHYSKQGQAFKTKAQRMHIEILQSPWLTELMAFHINLRGTAAANNQPVTTSNEHSNKPSLSCDLFDSIKVDIDLTCSICLDTVFDPVSLTCGHIFCYICACSAASVTIVDGLKSADPRGKCPLCREVSLLPFFLAVPSVTKNPVKI
ncbi:E3 ubiquitin-protein ligase BAH1 [Linum perenne]